MSPDLSCYGSDMLVLIQDPFNDLPFEVVWPDIFTFGGRLDLKSPNRALRHDTILFEEKYQAVPHLISRERRYPLQRLPLTAWSTTFKDKIRVSVKGKDHTGNALSP